jgi:hypothetical protein
MTLETDTPERPLNPEWLQRVDEGLDTVFEMYELLGTPIGLSPFDLTRVGKEDPLDSRLFSELNGKEKQHILSGAFRRAGFDISQPKVVESYTTVVPQEKGPNPDHVISPAGEVKGIVYDTERREEDMFVHHTTFPDGVRDWFIAPKDFRP